MLKCKMQDWLMSRGTEPTNVELWGLQGPRESLRGSGCGNLFPGRKSRRILADVRALNEQLGTEIWVATRELWGMMCTTRLCRFLLFVVQRKYPFLFMDLLFQGHGSWARRHGRLPDGNVCLEDEGRNCLTIMLAVYAHLYGANRDEEAKHPETHSNPTVIEEASCGLTGCVLHLYAGFQHGMSWIGVIRKVPLRMPH